MTSLDINYELSGQAADASVRSCSLVRQQAGEAVMTAMQRDLRPPTVGQARQIGRKS